MLNKTYSETLKNISNETVQVAPKKCKPKKSQKGKIANKPIEDSSPKTEQIVIENKSLKQDKKDTITSTDVEKEDEQKLIENHNDVTNDSERSDLEYVPNVHLGKDYCLLCSFYGKNIVSHYKNQHPESEVLISRMPLDQAGQALAEDVANNYSSLELETFYPESTKNRRVVGHFVCRLCNFTCSYSQVFFEHLCFHTGEYTYKCDKCDFTGPDKKLIKSHFYSR